MNECEIERWHLVGRRSVAIDFFVCVGEGDPKQTLCGRDHSATDIPLFCLGCVVPAFSGPRFLLGQPRRAVPPLG